LLSRPAGYRRPNFPSRLAGVNLVPLGKLSSTFSGVLSHYGLKPVLFGVALAMLLAPQSVLLLCFGLTGSSGNSIVTGLLLTIVTAAIALLCFRRNLHLLPADYLFVALLLCIVSSVSRNGLTSDTREYTLLVVSLAAYPACRLISRPDMMSARWPFIWFTGIVTLLGTIVTAVALAQQWNDQHGKPYVLGQDAGGTYFLGSLCFFIIALITSGRLTRRSTALISLLIFLPAAVFAASFVRFTFLALAGTLGLAVILSKAGQRKYVIAVGFTVFFAIVAGLAARYDKTGLYADYMFEQSYGDYDPDKPPSCYLKLNLRNSIAIRKVLVQDAVFLIPRSGWIGTGIDSFMNFSCIRLTEVHNSILQASVEFGWLGGSLLLLVIVFAAGPIFPLAIRDDAARFALCSLAFAVLLSLAHGRVSRDGVLFALLGCAVGVRESFRDPARGSSTVAASGAPV
jgi:hypothetical protein